MPLSKRAGNTKTTSRSGAFQAPLPTQPPQAPPQAPQAQPTPPPQPKPAQQVSKPPTGPAQPMTAADQTEFLNRQRLNMTRGSRAAINDYVNPQKQASGYAMSQDMNHKLNNNQPLNAREKTMQRELDKMMTPFNRETMLYRANHDAFLQRLGINPSSYTSNAALQNALVGTTWVEKGFSSTSHTSSKNPFWPGGYMSGGREVLMKIRTGKGAKAALVQSSQAEVLLARNTNYRITSAKFTGGMAYPQKGGAKKIIEIEVDVW